MPLYEYECRDCGRIQEFIQKFSDKPIGKCGSCSGKMHKLMSSNSFHLKGSGWYVTDYTGNESAKNPSKKENVGLTNVGNRKNKIEKTYDK